MDVTRELQDETPGRLDTLTLQVAFGHPVFVFVCTTKALEDALTKNFDGRMGVLDTHTHIYTYTHTYTHTHTHTYTHTHTHTHTRTHTGAR
jgi:hypothetical protein